VEESAAPGSPELPGAAAEKGPAMKHEVTFRNDIRELPPTEDGWKQFEDAGTCTVTCSCGFDSGVIPSTDVRRVASDHVGFDVAHPPATAE
jgi:hypothetical protein